MQICCKKEKDHLHLQHSFKKTANHEKQFYRYSPGFYWIFGIHSLCNSLCISPVPDQCSAFCRFGVFRAAMGRIQCYYPEFYPCGFFLIPWVYKAPQSSNANCPGKYWLFNHWLWAFLGARKSGIHHYTDWSGNGRGSPLCQLAKDQEIKHSFSRL